MSVPSHSIFICNMAHGSYAPIDPLGKTIEANKLAVMFHRRYF